MIAPNRTRFSSEAATGSDQRRGPGRPKGSRNKKNGKSRKPFATFPLTLHSSGQWCKKINGKIRYFGTDPDVAHRQYLESSAGLHSGEITVIDRRAPPTVGDLVNAFLAHYDERLEQGGIVPRTFMDYYRHCQRLVRFFGKSKSVASITEYDLGELRKNLAKNTGTVTLNGRLGAVRTVLKFAYDHGFIAAPVKLTFFKRPTRKELRKARKEGGRGYFYPEEIRKLLSVATPSFRAMILLGINCGLGNTDIASLPVSAIDLAEGWLDFARVKTGVDRRCPLWPETVEAIRRHQKVAPQGTTKETEGLLFVTRKGHRYVRSVLTEQDKGPPRLVEHDAIVTTFRRLMESAGIKLPGVAFYGLRKSCETFGAETGEQVAVDHIMGHAPGANDMGEVYRGHVDAEPLRRVTDHVRAKVFNLSKRGRSRVA